MIHAFRYHLANQKGEKETKEITLHTQKSFCALQEMPYENLVGKK